MDDAAFKFTKYSIFLQCLFKLKLKYTQYLPDNLSSYEWNRDPFVPTLSLTLTKKNTILTLPAMIPWKESVIEESRQIFGFHWMTNT